MVGKWNSWRIQYRQSIKFSEAEDWIDLSFYRPAGFLLAKLGQLLGASPTQLTLAGMIAGLLAGACFYSGSHGYWAGVFFFLLAGVLDSSDGQLARMSGRSSPIGLVLDGLCDNIVFISVYVGCILGQSVLSPWVIWPLALVAGFSHSLQNALLDFYKREYLYFGGRLTGGDYWNPTLDDALEQLNEAQGFFDRLFWKLRISWIFQQQTFGARSPGLRVFLRSALLGEGGERLSLYYRSRQKGALRLWHLLGANSHTFGIIVFAGLGRFELYLFAVNIVSLNLLLLAATYYQARADRALHAMV